VKEDSITKNERVGKRKNITVDDNGGIRLAAEAVNALAKGVADMRRYAKDKLIIMMLSDMTGLSKRDCQVVIDAIPELADRYLKVPR